MAKAILERMAPPEIHVLPARRIVWVNSAATHGQLRPTSGVHTTWAPID